MLHLFAVGASILFLCKCLIKHLALALTQSSILQSIIWKTFDEIKKKPCNQTIAQLEIH